MIGLVWNCRGIGHPTAVRCLKEYIFDHRPKFIFLSEVKCSSHDNMKALVHRLGFASFEFVSAVGKSRGLLLFWDDSINIKVVLSTSSIINCLVFRD